MTNESDFRLARALRALADAAPTGDVATAAWALCHAVAARHGATLAIHDLGRGANADADLPTALCVIADVLDPPAPRLSEIFR